MAASTQVAPPIPARKQFSPALSSASTTVVVTPSLTGHDFQTTAAPIQQQAITSRPPSFPADSSTPMVYVHSAAEGQAQTAFVGLPAAIQPLHPSKHEVNIEVAILYYNNHKKLKF